MEIYHITERFEYDLCIERGFNPLLDINHFSIDIQLRIKIQNELFGKAIIGKKDVLISNERFFRWVWDNKAHICEETMKKLSDYSAVYCSHILTRGAFPEIAHDPRNINILCFDSHNKWENGNRTQMRIYPNNLRIINIIKNDYK